MTKFMYGSSKIVLMDSTITVGQLTMTDKQVIVVTAISELEKAHETLKRLTFYLSNWTAREKHMLGSCLYVKEADPRKATMLSKNDLHDIKRIYGGGNVTCNAILRRPGICAVTMRRYQPVSMDNVVKLLTDGSSSTTNIVSSLRMSIGRMLLDLISWGLPA